MLLIYKRTQQRALKFTRSFTNAVRSKFLHSFSSDKFPTCSPFDHTLIHPTIPKHDISRPRPLRRGHIFPFKHVHFIHRLPVELLAQVFVLGAEDDAMLPVNVSHVCSSWREIALNTPSLWRRVTLSSNVEMWRARICRARACALDIQLISSIVMRSNFPQHQFLDADTVQWHIQLVIPFIQRWRSVEIIFTEYSPFLWNAALSGCCSRSRRTQALALEELSLIYRANDDTKEFCLFSGFAPRLRSVTLDGIRLTWLPSLFANLTHLDYTHHGFTAGYQAVQEVISMLEVSMRLIELRILFPHKRISATSGQSCPVARPVLLPFLSRLHLRVESPDIPFELAHIITLVLTPRLTSLQLIDRYQRYHSFSNLKSFFYLYAISPSLRSLRIEHGWYDPRMISPLVRALPNLCRLVVKRPHAPDQVLNLDLRKRRGGHQTEDLGRHMRLHVHPYWKPSLWQN